MIKNRTVQYFFVNLDKLGVPGVLMWVGILSVVFIAVGYLFYGLDRVSKRKEKKTKKWIN